MGQLPYTTAELAFVELTCTQPRDQALAGFQALFDRPGMTIQKLSSLCKRKGWKTGRTGRFTPGQTSHNKGKTGLRSPGSEKGWFKPGTHTGRANQNWQPIGMQVLRDEGYLWRKMRDDGPMHKRWSAAHVVDWQAVHGPVPPGHVLKCLDGNRQNIAPANWTPVAKAMLPRLSGGKHRYVPYDSAPVELKPTLLATARLEQAARQAKATLKGDTA